MKIDFDDDVIDEIIVSGLTKKLKNIKQMLKTDSYACDGGMHNEDIAYYSDLKTAIKTVLKYYGA